MIDAIMIDCNEKVWLVTQCNGGLKYNDHGDFTSEELHAIAARAGLVWLHTPADGGEGMMIVARRLLPVRRHRGKGNGAPYGAALDSLSGANSCRL